MTTFQKANDILYYRTTKYSVKEIYEAELLARRVLQKEIEKPVLEIKNFKSEYTGKCSLCGGTVTSGDCYCKKCGQRLGWREEIK